MCPGTGCLWQRTCDIQMLGRRLPNLKCATQGAASQAARDLHKRHKTHRPAPGAVGAHKEAGRAGIAPVRPARGRASCLSLRYSSMRERTIVGSTRTPGPMVEEKATLFT